MTEQKDPRLWQIAKKRAGFKQHLFSYVFVNILLWVIWWITHNQSKSDNNWPWPAWVTVIWGIFVVLDFFETYGGGDKHTMAEQEYEKLMKRKNQG